MHERNRYFYIAFGLVLGVGLALLFLFWSVPEFSDPYGYINERADEYQSHQDTRRKKSDNEPEWGYWTRRLFAAEDTLAQWIMAFFTVVIAGLTGVALCYIKKTADVTNRTLEEASKTAEAAKETVVVTREMGQAQTRAYLSIKSAKFTIQKDAILYRVKIENSGQTPAYDVQIDGECIVNTGKENPDGSVHIKSQTVPLEGGSAPVIGGKSTEKGVVGGIAKDTSKISYIVQHADKSSAILNVSWRDVFDRTTSERFVLNQPNVAISRITNSPIVAEGEMIVFHSSEEQ